MEEKMNLNFSLKKKIKFLFNFKFEWLNSFHLKSNKPREK